MTPSADQLGQYFVRIKNVKNEKSPGASKWISSIDGSTF